METNKYLRFWLLYTRLYYRKHNRCVSRKYFIVCALNVYVTWLTAKDTKMWKIVVPLIMGFKSTGALILAITSVKMFLLKALMVSKVALLAAGLLIVKKLLSTISTQHHPYLFAQHPVPYYHAHGLEDGYPSAYGYSNYVTAGGYYGAATAHGAPGYGPTSSGTLAAAEGDDLQAHFSTKVETNLRANTTNRTILKKDGKKND
jgi:hypothetical protein